MKLAQNDSQGTLQLYYKPLINTRKEEIYKDFTVECFVTAGQLIFGFLESRSSLQISFDLQSL